MAASVQPPARPGGGRRSRARRHAPMHEINVTPFVDVMLVLLIVFMVTAPLLTVSIPIELPQTEAKQSTAEVEPLTITIQQDGSIFLQETKVTEDELVPRLRAISREGYDRAIYIRGDGRTNWDMMAKVLASVSNAGFRKLQLVTDTEDAPGSRPSRE